MEITEVVLTAITMGVTQTVKMGGLDSKFLPIASIVVGIIVASLGAWSLSGASILSGIIYGLISSGLYDHIPATKSIVKGE